MKNIELKKQSKRFLDVEVRAMRESMPGQYYHEIKKMGFKTGECEDPGFVLPEHIEKGLSTEASAEKIADHFSQISQEFVPLNISNLPARVKDKLDSQDEGIKINIIEQYEVHEKIKHAKKTKSSVPGDIPPRIMKEFSPELSKPIAELMNKITASGIYPK